MKKEISFEEAIKLHREGKNFTYKTTQNVHTIVNYLINIAFSNYLRNPGKYKFFVEELRANPEIEKFKGSLPKKGTFAWAVEQMKQGKKVRIKTWEDGCYVVRLGCIFKTKLCGGEVESYSPLLYHLESMDWEIYEEPSKASERNAPKKTLWDKEFTIYGKVTNYKYTNSKDRVRLYRDKEIKEALKEFMNILYQEHDCFEANQVNIKVEEKAKEIFGKELVE